MTILVDDTTFTVTTSGTQDLTEWLDAGSFTQSTAVLRFNDGASLTALVMVESNDKSLISAPTLTRSGGDNDYGTSPLTCRYFKWQVQLTSSSGSFVYCIAAI